MNWSVSYEESGIRVKYLSYDKGTYNLLPQNSCTICSYPEMAGGRCPWQRYHPQFLKRIYAVGPYHKTSVLHRTGSSDFLSKDIYFLKNNAQKAEPLGLAIAACMKQRYPELLKYDYLVAVPQNESELHEDENTGELFNPIDPLVSWVSGVVGLKVLFPLVKTRPQSMEGLGLQERRKVTLGLYQCISAEVKGKSILLVDDVATTGSNLDKCAEALMKSGAKEVSAIVCGKDFVAERINNN